MLTNLFQSSDILLHIQTQSAKSWVMSKITPNLALFVFAHWKLGEGWARSLDQLMKPYLWSNLRNTFIAILCAAAESRALINQKMWRYIASWSRPTLRQSSSAWIMTPIPSLNRSPYPLQSYSVFTARPHCSHCRALL